MLLACKIYLFQVHAREYITIFPRNTEESQFINCV